MNNQRPTYQFTTMKLIPSKVKKLHLRILLLLVFLTGILTACDPNDGTTDGNSGASNRASAVLK
jgi:hypothetical protein